MNDCRGMQIEPGCRNGRARRAESDFITRTLHEGKPSCVGHVGPNSTRDLQLFICRHHYGIDVHVGKIVALYRKRHASLLTSSYFHYELRRLTKKR